MATIEELLEGTIHEGECFCDIGEYAGDKVHEWNCEVVRCLLGECKCERIILELLEQDAQDYLESSEYDVT